MKARQKGDLKAFEAMEATFLGRSANALKTAAISLDGERNLISRLFRTIGNAGERRMRFLAGQEAQKKALEKEQAAGIAERAAALKSAADARKAELRTDYLAERDTLKQRQKLEAARLKQAWRNRAADREKVLNALRAEPAPPQTKLDARAQAILSRIDFKEEFARGGANDPGRDAKDRGRDDDWER